MTAALTGKFNEVADPKVQLEQALQEAQEQDRRLKEQAANVIANQKQAEMRLNRAMGELEKVNGSAKQALLMADEAQKKGDAEKTRQYTQAAESFANRLIAVEKEVESLKQLSLQSAQAADQARSAVSQNSLCRRASFCARRKTTSGSRNLPSTTWTLSGAKRTMPSLLGRMNISSASYRNPTMA